MDNIEIHELATLVLLTAVGFTLLGVEQDTATTNADPSPLTFGMDDPTTFIV